jgi:hypothetical protein
MIRRAMGLCGVLLVGAMLTLSAAPAGAADGSLTKQGSGSVSTEAGATPRATYVYVILAHNCPAFNQASIRVRQRENGNSGTNYFQQIAQGQVFRNGFWQNRGNQAVQRSTQFPDDFRNFIYNGPNWVFTWNSEFNFSHRVLVKLQWWNNAGTPGFFGDDFRVANAAVFNRCT